MKKGACVVCRNASAPLPPRTVTNEVNNMKARMALHPQDEQRQWSAMLAADPAYAAWSEARHAADALTFDEWLDTSEGWAWLNDQAELDRFKRNGFHDLESWDYAAMGVRP